MTLSVTVFISNQSNPSHLILFRLCYIYFIIYFIFPGNCLVIAAVLCSSKLRSVTNLFIVSLAVADLLVGVAVLPFSATREVFEVNYIFRSLFPCTCKTIGFYAYVFHFFRMYYKSDP